MKALESGSLSESMVIRLPLCVWYMVVFFLEETLLMPDSVSFGEYYFV